MAQNSQSAQSPRSPRSRRPQVVGDDGLARPSGERVQCTRCSRTGWRSDWPGEGGIVADERGELVCDDCASEPFSALTSATRATLARLRPGEGLAEVMDGPLAAAWREGGAARRAALRAIAEEAVLLAPGVGEEAEAELASEEEE